MNKRKSRYIIIALFALLGFSVQGVAQIDTEFWFAAPDLEVAHAQVPVRFCVVSYDNPTTVVFEQPANPLFLPQTFQLEANDFHVYDVSNIIEMVETQPYNQVLNYGFHITATHPVSVYYESDNNNSEIYSLKGMNALGMSFVVPMQYTYENYYSSTCSRIEVVASQDDTEVTFYPSVAIKGGGLPGTLVTVSLNRGQSYAIEAASPQGTAHLRNTRITSTKPIAVNTSDDSVNLGGHYDLVGDQIVPVDLLGTDYLAIWNNNPDEHLFIFPTEDDTHIYLNGGSVPVATLNVGQEFTSRITSAVVYIHADKPVSVFQLSSSSQNEFGGTVLPQISCTGSLKTVYKRQSTSDLVVTLIVRTPYTNGFILNGNSNYITASDFSPVPANPDYSYCKKNVSNYVPTNGLMALENTYTEGYFHLGILTGDEGNTWNYGYFSDYQPYAYAQFEMASEYCAGESIAFDYEAQNVANLVLVLPDGSEMSNPPFVIENAQPENSGHYILKGDDCLGTQTLDVIDITVREAVQVNISLEGCNEVVWNGLVFTHSLDSVWTVQGGPLNACDSIYNLHVVVTYDETVTLPAIVACEEYIWHGTTYTMSGTYEYQGTTANGCLYIEYLPLTIGDTYHEVEEVNTCGSFFWPVNQQWYYESIVDSLVVQGGSGGCDSTFVLQLDLGIHDETSIEVPEANRCDGYLWDPQGMVYHTYDEYDPVDHYFTLSGIYHRTYTNQQGCDSIVTLYAQFEQSPDPSPIYPVDEDNPSPHWVITATEFQINYYDYQFWDNDETCHWDSVSWKFEDASIEWVIDLDSTTNPIGKTCRVYVTNPVADTIWLRATAYNRCKPEGVYSRFWLLCSFYNVDEHQVEAKLYPNPSKEVVNIEAEGIKHIRVIDMMGQIVEDREYENKGNAVLNLSGLKPAVYAVEVKTSRGTVIKRIIISK